jgi:hypothetical protein
MPFPEYSSGSVKELSLSRSQGLAQALIKNSYISLVGFYKNENIEFIKISVEVELPQHPPIPIHQVEEILIRIENETDIPKVFALREDFPQTMHQNIVPEGSPAWLCLYEDPWEEINPFITPKLFLERIREWLRRAATEELHLDDQPLEPFLVTGQKIFISEDILKSGIPSDHVLTGIQMGWIPQMVPVHLNTLPTIDKKTRQGENGNKHNFLGIQVTGSPTYTQVIHWLPQNLGQLIRLLKNVGVDLVNELLVFFRGMMQHKKITEYEHFQVIIFLHLPKSRRKDQEPESHEYWAFSINSSIKDLGIAIGALDSAFGVGVGYLLQGQSQIENLQDREERFSQLQVGPISPIFTLAPILARKSSGVIGDELGSLKIGAIGLGALGSTVVINLARQGIGKWILVDRDLLFPHNLVRHSLSGEFVGWPKSLAIQKSLEIDYFGVSIAEQFSVDYLKLNSQSEGGDECFKSLSSADIILDFSASGAVERQLAFDSFAAPRLSTYLVPSGKYCVIVYEGYGRKIRLDDLSQQVMAHVAQNPELDDLFISRDNKVQYAGSCRDLSQIIANDWFLGYAGVISKFIKRVLTDPDPKISIFSWQENPQCLREIPVLAKSYLVSKSAGWEIRTSEFVVSAMRKYRSEKLPNETGGIMLGKIDYIQQIVYVSHLLPSPPDSKEWPMAYIRGVKGLNQKVQRIRDVTSNSLMYIGEWHSHPTGVGINPSKNDNIALDWVKEFQASIGYPGLLAIIGDAPMPNYLLSQ